MSESGSRSGTQAPMSPGATKSEIRAQMKSRLKALSNDERLQRSAKAASTLVELIESQVPAGALLAVFQATPEEITLASALARLESRYRLCWPKVEGATLVFRACSEEGLVPGFRPWLPEPPEHAASVEPAALIVPGRAFSPRGGRMGRGAGFYDRALSALPQSLKMGYCFNFQQLDVLPLESHDELMTWLVTDEGPATHCT